MVKRILIAAFAVLSLLLASRYLMQGHLGRDEAKVMSAPKALPVHVAAVQEVDHYWTRRIFTGSVRPQRLSELGYERTGRLLEVRVTEGDTVRANQPLAQLDSRQLEAQRRELIAQRSQAAAQLDELVAGPREEAIRESRARLNDLQEQLHLSRIKRERAERLLKDKVVAMDSYDDLVSNEKQFGMRLEAARAELDRLFAGTRFEKIQAQQSAVQRLEAALDRIDIEIENSTLHAPYDGTVAECFFDEGSIVPAGAAVLRIIENAAPDLWIGIPASMSESIVLGHEYTVEISGKDYTARALSLLPELDDRARTITVIFRLNAHAATVYSGQLVRLELDKSVEETGIWVPTTALTRGIRGLWNLYALAHDPESPGTYRLEQRQVEVLYAEGDRLFVRGTLRAGDRIVTDGTQRVAAGQRVTPIDQTS